MWYEVPYKTDPRRGCTLRPPGSVPARVDYNFICRPYFEAEERQKMTPFGAIVYMPHEPPEECRRPKPPFNPCREPLFQVKSGVFLNRCECIHRNGLQDDCRMTRCMGRPECLTQPYPTCLPSGAWDLECL